MDARRLAMPSLATVLTFFALAAYGGSLGMPFIGDDYVFLDKTRTASFGELWAFANTDFGWYRPWSREVHFWWLQKLFGLHEPAFRWVGLLLWVAALCLYAAVVRRLAGARTAVVATLGSASLALWGTPLLWISGSQDLWMLVGVLASMLLFLVGRTGWAVVPFGLALLSKETAVVLPVLLAGTVVLLERRSLAIALRRTAHFWVAAIVWMLVHPILGGRLFDPASRHTVEAELRPAFPMILAKTALSSFNLDRMPIPSEVNPGDVFRLLCAVAFLAVGTVLLLADRSPWSDGSRTPNRGPLTRFALLWTVAGWAPLLLPSIGWRAYYGCLGSLGLWFGLGILLRDHRRIVVGALSGLVVLQWGAARAPSWDWGTEWYMRRAGNILAAIRTDLVRQHPTMAPHTRVYLGHLPNNIGLVAGRSPALRVWYRDETLQTDFYSKYRPRRDDEAAGQDLFFRFDTLRGMVEVKAGPEDVRKGVHESPSWETDHEALAMLFLRSGDLARAAEEFVKLAILPHRADAHVLAGVCWEFSGDARRAGHLYAASQARLRLSPASMNAWITALKRDFPRGGSADATIRAASRGP